MTENEQIFDNFKSNICTYWLNFQEPDLEDSYQKSAADDKHTPQWFKIFMWTLVFLVGLKRINNVIFAYVYNNANTETSIADFNTTVLFYCSGFVEIFLCHIKKLQKLRGLPIYISIFVHATYDSYYYNPSLMCYRTR